MSTKLALTSGGAALNPEDVFASWVYTGTGATLNIQNDINLSTFGGMVWTKSRGTTESHYLCDTVRGAGNLMAPDLLAANQTPAGSLTAFNNNGYTLGNAAGSVLNVGARTYASWSFRRAPKFFDVVTYTGTGAARTVPHALNIAPGFIMVFRTDVAQRCIAYHVSAGAGNWLPFVSGSAAATASTTMWNNTAPTASVFSLGNDTANTAGGSYVAYLFAHDTGPDGLIQCGSYAGNTGTFPSVTLGWEPQFIIFKPNVAAIDWSMLDELRDMNYNHSARFLINVSSSESALGNAVAPTATGFRLLTTSNNFNPNGSFVYYVAIRRRRKIPTSGSSVFTPFTYVGNGGAGVGVTSAGFPLDLLVSRLPGAGNEHGWWDRIRGTSVSFGTTTLTQALSGSTSDLTSLASMNGFAAGANSQRFLNSATTILAYAMRRARGFMDIVYFTGNGAISHSLEAVPEMMIFKSTASGDWRVYHSALGNTQYAVLNTTAAAATSSTYWNNTSPTNTQFTAGTAFGASDWVAYLFASLPGISKVGSYTGNGTSQTIDCGFSTGARFVVAKRTSANGPATTGLCNGWNVADTARGISASAEPTSAFNITAADLTPNWLTPASSGFTVVQDSNNDMNVNGATYIYLAIA
jgi:hypothetical protein